MLLIETLTRRLVEQLRQESTSLEVTILRDRLDVELTQLHKDRAVYNAEVLRARRLTTDELEIDDDPLLSIADEGVWVSAWMWIETETERDYTSPAPLDDDV